MSVFTKKLVVVLKKYTIKFLTLINYDSNAFDQEDWFRYVGTPDYSFLKITVKFITYKGLRLNAIFYFPKTLAEVKRAYKIITA